jgi:hypothetical protein
MLSWELLHSICVGGVGVHVTELAAALERKGHELHVFTRMGVVNLSMRASTAYTLPVRFALRAISLAISSGGSTKSTQPAAMALRGKLSCWAVSFWANVIPPAALISSSPSLSEMLHTAVGFDCFVQVLDLEGRTSRNQNVAGGFQAVV